MLNYERNQTKWDDSLPNRMHCGLNAEGLILTWIHYEFKSCSENYIVRLEGFTPTNAGLKMSFEKRITIIRKELEERGEMCIWRIKARTIWNVRWIQRRVLHTLVFLLMTLYCANIKPGFSFWMDCFCMCETGLLLSLVRAAVHRGWSNLPVLHRDTHASFHFSFLLRCWFAVPKPPTHPPFIPPEGSCSKPALLCRPEKV